MITIQKIQEKFYIKIFSTSTPEFNAIILVLRTKGFKYDGKGSTHSNPKLLLDAVDELADNFETFVSDSVRKEINDFSIYSTIKPRRLKIDESFFEKFPPKGDYQIDDVKKMVSYGRLINACKMGLGKTFETVQTINQLFSLDLADRVLIITIPSTIYNWKHEILQFSDLFSEEDILIVTEKNRNVFYDKELPKVVICSYNTFKLCSDYSYKQNNKGNLKDYRKAQIDFSFWGTNRVLICDEVHTIKNMTTRWTQVVHMEKQYFNFRYGLSATPSPNGIQELYSSIKFLDDDLIDNNYIDFLRTIGNVGTKYSQYALDSIDDEKAKVFYDRVKPYIIRRFLRDHIELPQVYRKNIYIELTGIQKQIYQSVVNDSLTAIKEEKGVLSYNNIQMKFPYILQSLSDPLLIQDKILELCQLKSLKFDDCVKVTALDGLLSDLFYENKKRKIIVWGIHPLTLDRLSERYLKYKPVVIHGSNTPKGKEKNKWRYEQILNFKESDSQVLIANPSVIGTGTNISFANAIIHYDRDFNYTTNEQSDGRMERIGLNKEATIYNLIVANSLEIHLEKALDNKKMIDDTFLSTGNLTQSKVKDIFNPK